MTHLITLLAFAHMSGQAQVKCHIEGLLKDKTQGTTVIVRPASLTSARPTTLSRRRLMPTDTALRPRRQHHRP